MVKQSYFRRYSSNKQFRQLDEVVSVYDYVGHKEFGAQQRGINKTAMRRTSNSV